MDVLKDLAIKFPRRENLIRYRPSLERFDSELNDALYTIRKDEEKLRFLGYLKDLYETSYQEHARVCKDPDTCSLHESHEIALYSINQQYDEFYEELGGVDIQEKPAMQYFVEGQYFDAYNALRECVKPAKRSIILIDGYVNADTIAFFPTKEPAVKLRILTNQNSLNDSFNLAVKVYNRQYTNLVVYTSNNYHDRFLIIDETDFYHIGASIKDAGNKKFMFSKIEDEGVKETIIGSLKKEWKDVLQ